MVGRCISYWNSFFLGDMLVFGGVSIWRNSWDFVGLVMNIHISATCQQRVAALEAIVIEMGHAQAQISWYLIASVVLLCFYFTNFHHFRIAKQQSLAQSTVRPWGRRDLMQAPLPGGAVLLHWRKCWATWMTTTLRLHRSQSPFPWSQAILRAVTIFLKRQFQAKRRSLFFKNMF